MDDAEALARGNRAFNELEELNAVFDKLERNTIEKLKSTPIGQDDMVTKLHMTLHTLSGIRSAMREMIDNGRVAEHALAVSGLHRPI